MAIIDSFGKTLSVCQKGLILESDHPVYLPLYPGECNIPLDIDNSTVSSAAAHEHISVEEKQQQQQQPGSIGPFTKEQNYETKDSGYSVEVLSTDRIAQRKNLGPFTKEQNLRAVEVETMAFAENAEKRRNIPNPWTVLDISSDGDSNSLENADSEHGRSFSGANLVYHTMQRAAETNVTTSTTTATSITTVATTEFLPEIREPVLHPSKKEIGRSLKLPEITEPILRPRATRHNTRNEAVLQQYDNQRDEIQETSSTSTRSFTVQFLPERLASILAQAERYARQTLLPFISQYTPSFITGMRSHEEPKYFPLLGDVAQSRNTDASAEIDRTTDRQRNNDQFSRKDTTQRKSDDSFSLVEDGRRYKESKSRTQMENGENVSNENVSKAEAPPVIVEAVYPEKVADANFTDPSETRTTEIRREDGDWRPIDESTKNVSSRRDSNVSRSLNWSINHSRDWTFSADANSKAKVKLDDWIPITIKNDAEASTTARLHLTTLDEETARKKADGVDNSRKSAQDIISDDTKEETTAPSTYERKFIPLLDLEETTGDPFSSTNSYDIPEFTTAASHIQKIPRHEQATMKNVRMMMKSTMMFPYAYERRNDPRTRYIPLIPEEDMGKPYSLMERDR